MLTGCFEKLNGGSVSGTSSGGGNAGKNQGKTRRPSSQRPSGKRPNNPNGPLPPFLGLDTLLSTSSVDDDHSHGIVFDIQTAGDASALIITDLEFYSSSSSAENDHGATNSEFFDRATEPISYQVYYKEGTWRDSRSVRDYRPLSVGNMTLDLDGSKDGNNNETNNGYVKHRIPLTVKLKLNGNGTRYSMYVGLSEKIMLYQQPPQVATEASVQSAEEDTIPLLKTKDFTIYAGGAIMIYPLSKANHPVYYRTPRGFVGRIWYERDACETDVWDWEECGETKGAVGAAEREEIISRGRVYYGGLDGAGAPAASPSPNANDEDGKQVYLVITFGEAPKGKLMDESAQSSFERVVYDYYMKQEVLSENQVDLDSVKVWYQQYLVSDSRLLQNDNNEAMADLETALNTAQPATVAQYQVTVILSVIHSSLPELITRDLLENALKNDTSTLLKSLKLTPELTPYLQDISYISSILSVDELTSPPTNAPSLSTTVLVTAPIETREPIPPILIAFIVIGMIYAFSVIFSTCYIKRARSQMEYDASLKELLKSTTIEDDIRGNKSDFAEKGDANGEAEKRKQSGIGMALRQSMLKMTSVKDLMADEDLGERERTSSAEDSSSEENSGGGSFDSDDLSVT